MRWLLRIILVVAVASGLARSGAILINEGIIVAEVVPKPSVPEPSVGPTPIETVEPLPSATPTPTPAPDIEIDVTLPSVPPLPVVQPPVVVPPPPSPPPPPAPEPSCFPPGGSGASSGVHTGWDAQGRECAGKPAVTILALTLTVMAYRRRQ